MHLLTSKMIKKNKSFEQETPHHLIKRLNLKVKNLSLLTRALTHRSFINEHPDEIEDNERLEFLGDAVLDFIVADWLYNHFPEMLEGNLTQMRSALVQTNQLAEFAAQLNLGGAIQMGKGEEIAGGRTRNSLLCDSFEALVGAIYLDCGIGEVQSFMSSFLDNAMQDILLHQKNEDPKSKLQELTQSIGSSAPIYKLKNTIGPDHQKTFEVEVVVDNISMAIGKGPSKQYAEKVAAKNALIKMEKEVFKR